MRAANLWTVEKVFTIHCMICHQIGGKGQSIGPTLDAIGSRGAERLLEDILDPNRNVDAAFNLSVLTLKNGDVLTGMVRGEEKGSLTLADIQGKLHTISTGDVTKRETTGLSLMPPAFGDVLSEKQLYDLIEFMKGK